MQTKKPSKKIPINPVQLGSVQAFHKCGCEYKLIPTAAGSSKILNDLTERLMQSIWDDKEDLGAQGELIIEEALQLVKGLKDGYGMLTAWNTPDVLAYQLMEYNLFEFSESKTEARLAAMTDLLIDKEKLEIRSFEDFKKLAGKEVESFNEEWLLSEYNLSISVGQNSAAYHRFLAEKDDFPLVEYQTAGDSKVRNQHAKLDGKVFNMNDREAMKLWPPNGYGCRCEFIQTNRKPDRVTSGSEGIETMKLADPKWSKSQFEINRGDLKQVFTNEQFYADIKGMDKKINSMTFESYGIDSYQNFKSDLNSLKLDKTITEDNLDELFKTTGQTAGKKKYMGFQDYFGRRMILQQDTFKRHTSGNYLKENRHQLFTQVNDVLKSPDEVWLTRENNKKHQTLKYVKYFKNTAIVVVNEIRNNQVEMKTWFEMKEEKDTRNGLLIKRKS